MSGDSPEPSRIVCTCNNCSVTFEFDASNAGETIQCPNCKMDTVLFVPSVPIETVAPPPEPIPKPVPRIEPIKAELIEQTTYKDVGVEARLELTQFSLPNRDNNAAKNLEDAGNAFLGLGVIGGIVGAGIAAATESIIYLVVGVVAVFQGVVIRFLFKAGAEMIYLLQSSSAGRFTGKITQLSVHHNYKCSLCNAVAQPAQARCSRCGTEFKS